MKLYTTKEIMDTSSKNRLQEYCNKHKFLLPNYRVIKQSGPMHALRFQVIDIDNIGNN